MIMQQLDGSLKALTEEEHDSLGFFNERKTVQVNQVFKIRHTFFQITQITFDGIVAKGISRKKYYDLKRGRSDWF
jgi:hypothetical protein